MFQLLRKSKEEKKPKVSETDAKRKVGQDFDSVWQDYRCKRTLITPASRLIYSVFNSILHLHKMLVFSCWDYNHNKLFADALGLHRVKKKKRKEKNQAVVGIKMGGKKKKNHEKHSKKIH